MLIASPKEQCALQGIIRVFLSYNAWVRSMQCEFCSIVFLTVSCTVASPFIKVNATKSIVRDLHPLESVYWLSDW